MPVPRIATLARTALARYLSDLRASRKFLAAEMSGTGWLSLGEFRWRNVAPARAARTAFGVLVPLIIGVATGHIEYGTFAGLGALPAGFVAFRGVTRSRVLLVAITATGMAISTFIGATSAASAPWVLVPVIVGWAYVAGICAALGPSAIAVTLQWPVAVLIGSAIPFGPRGAAVRAGLVLAGGLWQGALVASSWAVNRGSAERTAMAESYAALSEYATAAASGHTRPPEADCLPGTNALRDPNPLMRTAPRQHLVDLMEEAERIRSTLVVLSGPPGDTLSPHRKAFLQDIARSLAEVAAALGSRPAQRAAHLRDADRFLAADEAEHGHSWSWAGEALYGQLRSAVRITRRLNNAEPATPRLAESVAAPADGAQPPPAQPPPAQSPPAQSPRAQSPRAQSPRAQSPRARSRVGQFPAAQSPWAPNADALPTDTPGLVALARDLRLTLRANLGTASEAGRHALRLAAVAGLTEVIVLAADLPHGYWATLTVLIVLRPDYGSTLYRGLQRSAGTVVGAGLGVATVLIGNLGSGYQLAVVGASLFGAYAVFTVNYLFYAIFVTDFVVVMLSAAGLPADQTALDRLIGTGVGTALAMIAYLLWPTWERASASEKFARLFLAEGRFPDMLLRAYSRPDSHEFEDARAFKVVARRERLDAEASADRLSDEPERPPVTREFAQALVSAGHRLAMAELALEAAVQAHHADLRRACEPDHDQHEHPEHPHLEHAHHELAHLEHAHHEHSHARRRDAAAHDGWAAGAPDPLQPDLDRLADMVRQASVQLAAALRRMGPPGPLPPLRELHAHLQQDIEAEIEHDAKLEGQDGVLLDVAQDPGHHDIAALVGATDALVDALNTAADILQRYLAQQSSRRP